MNLNNLKKKAEELALKGDFSSNEVLEVNLKILEFGKDSGAITRLGRFYFEKKDYAQALKYFKKIDGNDSALHIRIARNRIEEIRRITESRIERIRRIKLVAQQKQEKTDELKSKQEKIRYTVNARGIRSILHFTVFDNLKSILEKGILSRYEMQRQGIETFINDEQRLDFRLNHISCSISLPNAPLLFRLKQNYHERKYVLLKIKPDILWKKECLFCKENAASKKVSSRQYNSSAEDFEKMFEDYDDKHTRKKLENIYNPAFIENNMPTHNQAEVLIKQKIEPEYITGVYAFEDDWRDPVRFARLAEIGKRYNDLSWKWCPEEFLRRCKQPEKSFWEDTKNNVQVSFEDFSNKVSLKNFYDEIPF